jgi:hypothetical protein
VGGAEELAARRGALIVAGRIGQVLHAALKAKVGATGGAARARLGRVLRAMGKQGGWFGGVGEGRHRANTHTHTHTNTEEGGQITEHRKKKNLHTHER